MASRYAGKCCQDDNLWRQQAICWFLWRGCNKSSSSAVRRDSVAFSYQSHAAKSMWGFDPSGYGLLSPTPLPWRSVVLLWPPSGSSAVRVEVPAASLWIFPASLFGAELPESHTFPTWEGNPFTPPQSASPIFLAETCRSMADKAQSCDGKEGRFPEILCESRTSPWPQVCAAAPGRLAAAVLAAQSYPISPSAFVWVTSSPAPFTWWHSSKTYSVGVSTTPAPSYPPRY